MTEKIISLSDEMVNYRFAIWQFNQAGKPVVKSIADKYIKSLEKSGVFSEEEIAFEKKKALRYTAPIVGKDRLYTLEEMREAYGSDFDFDTFIDKLNRPK